jgi:hypothetical protein
MRRNNAGLLFVILAGFLAVFIIGIITDHRQVARTKPEFSQESQKTFAPR